MADSAGTEVGRISIRVTPNTDRFRSELKKQLESIERSMQGEVPIDLTINENNLRQKVKAAAAAASGADATVSVDANTVKANAQLDRLKRQHRDLRITPTIDLPKLPRVGLGIPLPSIDSSMSISGMATSLAKFAAILSLVPPAISLASGAMATLPAMAAGVAVPVAAIALGIDGIKESAKALDAPMQSLKNTMNQSFKDGLTPVFSDLKSVFPVLEKSMPTVSKGLVDMAQGFTDATTSTGGKSAIENTISSIGTALSAASPGVESFTNSMLTMTEKVSAKFPGLSESFNNVSNDFMAWVDKISTAGGDGKSPLDNAMSNLKGTLSEISGLLTDMASTGFDWMAEPEFGAKLKDLAADLRSIVNESLPEMKRMFEDVAAIISGMEKGLQSLKEWAPFKDESGEGDLWSSTLQAIPIVGTYLNNLRDAGGQATTAVDGVKDAVNGIGAAAETNRAALDALLSGGSGSQVGGNVLTELQNTLQSAPAPKVPEPNTDAAEAKVSEYAAFVDTITAQVRGSLQQATTGDSLPAPNFEAFKAAWSGVVTFVDEQVALMKASATALGPDLGASFQGTVDSARIAFSGISTASAPTWETVKTQATTAFDGIAAKAAELPAKITAALSGLQAAGEAAGNALVQGMTNGITAKIPSAVAAATDLANQVDQAARTALGIRSPSRVFTEIGQYTAEGFGVGLASGFQPVLDQAKSMAAQIEEAFKNGVDLSDVLGGDKFPNLRQMLDTIDEQSKTLKVQMNEAADDGTKDSLKDQRSQLQIIRDQLALQDQQLRNEAKYGEQLDESNAKYKQMLETAMAMPTNFAEATGQQFMSDLGIGGNGAIPQLAGYVMGYGKKLASNSVVNNYNIANLDEALAIERNKVNVASLQYRR